MSIQSLDSSEVTAAVDELIASVASGGAAMLIGAGVSLHAGLPLVGQLTPYVLSKFDLSKDDMRAIAEARLPFEALFELVIRHTHRDDLFSVFGSDQPAIFHWLVAKLVRAHRLDFIVTTNFDDLFERALAGEQLVAGMDYDLLTREDQLVERKRDGLRPCLAKIHGSIGDPSGMAVTLTRVARRDPSAGRDHLLRGLFVDGRHETVIVLGYSCSDVFDVSPAITALDGERKRVIVVQHADESRVEAVSIQRDNNPFQTFQGLRLFYDTDRLVERLWNTYVPGEPYVFRSALPCWQHHVDAWSDRNTREIAGFASHVPALILHSIGCFERAGVHAANAAQRFRDRGDERGESYALQIEGLAYHGRAQFAKAIAVFERTLATCERIGDTNGVRANLVNLANACARRGDYAAAENYVLRLRDAGAGDQRDAVGLLIQLGELEARRGNLEKAREHVLEACGLARQTGEKLGEAVALGNLATVQKNLGLSEQALASIDASLVIYESVRYRAGIGTALSTKANVLLRLGRLAEARDTVMLSLKIARELGDRNVESSRLGLLGVISAELGDAVKAVASFQRGLDIAIEIGNRPQQVEHLKNLAQVFERTGDAARAADYEARAKAIVD